MILVRKTADASGGVTFSWTRRAEETVGFHEVVLTGAESGSASITFRVAEQAESAGNRLANDRARRRGSCGARGRTDPLKSLMPSLAHYHVGTRESPGSRNPIADRVRRVGKDSDPVIEIRTPTRDDYPAMGRQIHESFGQSHPDELEREQVLIDFDRFRIADDTTARRVVGVSGSWAMEMTLPGGALMPMGGVTWVAVSPTYRRQGILTRMMDSLHADIAARDEPLAGLAASEAPIYGRFGYAIATYRRKATIDRRVVSFASEFIAPAGSVSLYPGDDPGLIERISPRWDRYRRGQAGELDRSDDRHRHLVANLGAQAHFAFHDDGYASWKVNPDWTDAPPKHELRISDFVASSSAAYEALWSTIFSIDLVGPVVTWNMPIDDPLPYLISNPRAVRTSGIDDNVWLKVLDLPAVFGRRTYGVDDDVVIDVGGSRWSVGAGGCSRARRRADLVIDPTMVGSLVLGGVSPSTLHAGHRLEARSAEALRRADLLFRTFPDPRCQTPI